MQLIMTADEAAMHRVVGTDIFLRGRQHMRQGAVVSMEWQDRANHVLGRVRGTARDPYTAVAALAKSPDGRLITFAGSCTCPERTNCEHAVALLLAAMADTRGKAHRCGKAGPSDTWEHSLAALIHRGSPNRVSEAATIGLQFELAGAESAAGPDDPQQAFRLGVRPVLAGQKGNWVRTGISWSNLSYMRHSQGVTGAHVRLLAEIMALNSTARPAYYGYQDHTIYLDSIVSRRIWDLLAEARELGLPMVHAGRQPSPVVIHTGRAQVSLEVGRSGGGLDLEPRVEIDGQQVLLNASQLLGSPAHGIVWWQSPDEPTPLPAARSLRLAALAAPVDAGLRDILAGGAVRVPAEDEGRFLHDYYPVLLRMIPLVPGDESVVLPEPRPPVLSLAVEHLDGHRVQLDWEWLYGVGDADWREPLWPQPEALPSGRDISLERDVLEDVITVGAAAPELFEVAGDCSRLAASSSLAGFATVRFLAEVLPRLAELPEVAVSVTGTATGYRASDSAPVISFSGSASASDRDWFDLAVTVSVDDEDVPFDQLFVALAEGQRHLILPTGTYFSLDREEFRQLAQLIVEARALQDAPAAQTLRLSRFHASLWDELNRLGVVSGQAAAWQDKVRALSNVDELVEHEPPHSLQATLRPYQRTGFNWLTFLYSQDLGGVLADEMGLGKTLQTLALFCHARDHRLADAPFLVVAPTSVVCNWASECRKFAPDLKVVAITETHARRGVELADIATDADVVVTSYTLFRLEYDDYAALPWSGLVLDEAQFVKNHQSQNYQCAKKLPVPFKLAVTGTPMENNLMELWSLLSITAPGLFASPKQFAAYYRIPIEKGKNRELLSQLRRRIRPLVLRRTKEHVLKDLPAKQEQIIELELGARHKKIYQTYLQRERQKVLGLLGDVNKNRFEIFRSLTLLRQASLDMALVDPKHAKIPSTKLDALMEQIGGIAGDGHRTLVFSQFTRFLDAARRRLDAAGVDYCYLDGKTRNRSSVLAEFKSGTAPVFLISLKAGGFGLNLTEADYCILLDPWWNPATETQAVDRVHRIGQTKKVMVYRLVAKDTIEEKVMALKATKAALFDSVMNGGEFESGALTAADIRGLLA